MEKQQLFTKVKKNDEIISLFEPLLQQWKSIKRSRSISSHLQKKSSSYKNLHLKHNNSFTIDQLVIDILKVTYKRSVILS